MEEQNTKQVQETKICKHCQSEIPKKAKICPNCRKKQKKGIVKWIVIVVIVLFVLSALANGGDSDEPSNKNPKKVDSTNNESKEEEKEDKKEFSVGDVVETSDLKITFISADKYKEENEFSQPKKGNTYYRMQFEFENIGDSDQTISSLSNWTCYADGYAMEQYFGGEDEMDGSIAPGKKMKGSVYFQMPKKSKEITLEYECNFWTEDKVIFKVK